MRLGVFKFLWVLVDSQWTQWTVGFGILTSKCVCRMPNLPSHQALPARERERERERETERQREREKAREREREKKKKTRDRERQTDRQRLSAR